MTDNITKLREILGDARFQEITSYTGDEETQDAPTNAKEIFCECKTLILRPRHAKLIRPSESMLTLEKDYKTPKPSSSSFKNLCEGCYWLVDDMYKFEQIGYTKEVLCPILNNSTPESNPSAESSNVHSRSPVQSGDGSAQTPRAGLRYLVCAECNVCPLGWYDPRTKESYLYVW